MKELKNLKELVETIHNLYSSYEDIGLLIEMGYEDEDPEMVKELEEEIHTFEKVFEKLKIQTLLSGEYDSCNAIMTIHPEPAEQNPVTGQVCFTVCTAGGQRERDSHFRCWISWTEISPELKQLHLK